MPPAKRCSFIPAPFTARVSRCCARAMASSSSWATGARKGLGRPASAGRQRRALGQAALRSCGAVVRARAPFIGACLPGHRELVRPSASLQSRAVGSARFQRGGILRLPVRAVCAVLTWGGLKSDHLFPDKVPSRSPRRARHAHRAALTPASSAHRHTVLSGGRFAAGPPGSSRSALACPRGCRRTERTRRREIGAQQPARGPGLGRACLTESLH